MTMQSPTEISARSPDTAALIAECAYYKAERRGFAPGFELDDWLAAESEILARPAANGAAKVKRARKTAAAAKR